jgi:predicted nucleic acid-binding protein
MYQIYLDNCCFNRPYDDQTIPQIQFETRAKIFIQSLVLSQEVALVWSYILKFENSRNPFDAKRTAIAEWQSKSILFVDASAVIVSRAEDIARTGIGAFDALHIACAIEAGCDFCITVDKRMQKYNGGNIIVCSPMEFLNHYFNSKENE